MPHGVGVNWPWQLVKLPLVEEMTQLIGCLLQRLKDLSSGARHPVKKPGMVIYTVTRLGAGEVETDRQIDPRRSFGPPV